MAAIEEDFGIPIQHTVVLNFDQFANIVEALGGINMSFPDLGLRRGLRSQRPGRRLRAPQRHPGSRGGSGPSPPVQAPRSTTLRVDWPQETSDLARIRRDHEFLRVLATAVAKQGLGNPITDLNLINSVKADLTFDQSWSVTDMANLVLDFHSVNIDSVPS